MEVRSEETLGSTLLKADEVDVDGSLVPRPPTDKRISSNSAMIGETFGDATVPDIATLPVSRALPSTPITQDTLEVQQTGPPPANPTPVLLPVNTKPSAVLPPRPPLRRDKSIPMPIQSPTPAPDQAFDDPDTPQDSITLMQLKELVTEFPRVERTPYAFEYADKSTFEEELEEYIGYSAEERSKLLRTCEVFEENFRGDYCPDAKDRDQGGTTGWYKADHDVRRRFLERLKGMLGGGNGVERSNALACLVYIALGIWNELGNVEDDKRGRDGPLDGKGGEHMPGKSDVEKRTELHLSCIRNNVHEILDIVGPQHIFEAARPASSLPDEATENVMYDVEEQSGSFSAGTRRTSWAAITLMYLLLEVALRDSDVGDDTARGSILSLEPKLLDLLTDWLVESRWDDSAGVPSYKLLLLYWKTLLLTFGGTLQADEIKHAFEAADPQYASKDDELRITASPLDYHIFRQEIISKYPAFDPPPPLFPFEPEQNSILPPLQEHNEFSEDVFGRPFGLAQIGLAATSGSIIHQPVHIATPAPSPPPSPAGPNGKGIKKQNYQTNQMFPFLYPPLEESSNDLGGKGSTALQDLLVGRKWHGSDIPASILEAADLFARRMKATRAMKQLWEERLRFSKFERGHGSYSLGTEYNNFKESEQDIGMENAISADMRERLKAVEDFYKRTLPNLQSLVLVLVKALLHIVMTMATLPNAANLSPNGATHPQSQSHPQPQSDSEGHSKWATQGDTNGSHGDTSQMSVQEIDQMRSQEIMYKAVSGILIVLLKFFKISHVLKFEYLTQLLLDSNYIQLTLKMFTHQELDRVVSFKLERKELNFFQWCRAQTGLKESTNDAESSPQTALPPSRSPPKHHHSATVTIDAPFPPKSPPPLPTIPPAVDELGNPTVPLPLRPLFNFSTRAFLALINTLRTLQKLLKSHPHRQLLMVTLKYSNTLKKALRVPHPLVRLYTLKIIKGQVPYCHRKWRQGNMRVLTAIYLHVRPDLRDEWLAGCDVDQEVGEALPMERAVRGLCVWWHLRRYMEGMGVVGVGEREIGDDESSEVEYGGERRERDGLDEGDGAERDEVALESGKDGDGTDEFRLPPPRRSSSRNPLDVEPDFFLQELERMDLRRLDQASATYASDCEEVKRAGDLAEVDLGMAVGSDLDRREVIWNVGGVQ